ncbi:MAG: DNA polymerase III subunit delta [Armatimonadetes bacterium]|nr:DNA polymerase III subunit delta [Armatimonadota bacterium]
MPAKKDARPDAASISRVYLFTGESDVRRRSAVADLTGTLVAPASEGFDLETVDGDSSSAEAVLSAVSTAPFMSERKVVVVERVERLPQDDQEAIAAFIPKLPALSCLILLAGENAASASKQSNSKPSEEDDEDEQKGRREKKGLSTALQKAVKAHGTLVSFAKLRSNEMQSVATATARKLGKTLNPGAAAAISRAVEGSAALLEREIEKLAAYVGDREEITMADVQSVATLSPEDRVFALIDAIGGKQAGEAMRLLDETLAASPKPEGEVLRILALLARNFRLLYQMRFMKEAGVRSHESAPEEIRDLLPKDQSVLSLSEWQLRKLAPQTGCFTSAQLVQSLRAVLDCELAIKGLGAEAASNRLSLEMLLVKLCGLK